MRRSITGFTQDDEGDWVAHLSCLHRQHVRHRPPFQDRAWVLVDAERQGRVGTDIDCPLCDRTALPDGLHVIRTAGPFDAETLPAGLRREHKVASATWGMVRVLEGSVTVSLAVDPPLTRTLHPGDEQPLPPDVPHHLALTAPSGCPSTSGSVAADPLRGARALRLWGDSINPARYPSWFRFSEDD